MEICSCAGWARRAHYALASSRQWLLTRAAAHASKLLAPSSNMPKGDMGMSKKQREKEKSAAKKAAADAAAEDASWQDSGGQ
eukprot:COSAG05_NODE_7342_length_824_cov_1.477241_1_plen_81_part_01